MKINKNDQNQMKIDEKRAVLAKKCIFYKIAFLLLLYPIFTHAERAKKKTITIPPSINYAVENYLTSGGRSTEIGIAIAKKDIKSANRLPVVVFIHGGGWQNGDKDQSLWQCFRYASEGFIGITLSYRLINEAPFPQCIEDVKTAIRYIKSLANEYPIDTDNIGVWGYSAGAHLALMIGLSHEDGYFRSSLYPDFDSSVKCVVAIAAPTYFSNTNRRNSVMSESQRSDPSFLERVSPLSYIHEGQIPVLMIHGTKDKIVPVRHYRVFQESCIKKGIKNFTLVEATGGGHMFFFKGEVYRNRVYDYFESYLKMSKKGSE